MFLFTGDVHIYIVYVCMYVCIYKYTCSCVYEFCILKDAKIAKSFKTYI